MTEHLLIKPDPANPRLTRGVSGVDHNGEAQEIRVVEERPLTSEMVIPTLASRSGFAVWGASS